MDTIIVKEVCELIDKINEIIEKYWKFKKFEKPVFPINISFNRISEKQCNNSSNYNNALKQCFNQLGVDNFLTYDVNYEPRFDIAKSRNKGFSFSGRNHLLIAFREFENEHIEITYTVYTDWL
jgi:hypothetical protein